MVVTLLDLCPVGWLEDTARVFAATVDQHNLRHALHRAHRVAGVDHGSLATFRCTVMTLLAEAGLRPEASSRRSSATPT